VVPRQALPIFAVVAAAYAVGAQVAYDWFGAGVLIERRGEPIDRGLERLLDASRSASGLAVDELCGVLVADLLDGQPILDDVVVLAVRLAASPAAARAATEGAAPTLSV
jgi:hypothetical protein